MQDDERKPGSEGYAKYLRHSHIGLQFILPILLFTGGGIWLGRKYDQEALFTLLGLALGFAVGFWSLYKELYGFGPGGSDTDQSGKDSEDESQPPKKNEL